MKKIVLCLLLGVILSLFVASADTCTETDGGDNPLVLGTVTNYNGTVIADQCYSYGSYASCTEYYCIPLGSSGDIAANYYFCDSTTPTACDLQSAATYSYAETDAGNDALHAGETNNVLTLSFNSINVNHYVDTCTTSTKLTEYYVSGTHIASTSITCSSTYGSTYSCMTDANGYGYCGTSAPACVSSSCGAYVCDTAVNACYTSCTSDSQCGSGYICGVLNQDRSMSCAADANGNSIPDASENTCSTDCGVYTCDTTLGVCNSDCDSDSTCDSGAVCDLDNQICAVPNSGVETACTDLRDNDGDDTIDRVGGCDSTGDGAIDYICGCARYTGVNSNVIRNMVSYTSDDHSCPRTSRTTKYGYICYSSTLTRPTSFTDLMCGPGEDIEGIWYDGDTDCVTTNVIPRAAELESDGFFSRFFNWLIFWN